MVDRKLLVVFLAVLLVAGVIFYRRPALLEEGPGVKIGGQTILVEVADTPKKRARGLSGRESISENQGMLFVFSESANRSFWMNKMRFNLDFVFINDGRVVGVVKDVPSPKSGELPEVINIQKPSDRVLEVNAGMVEKWGIKVGDEVEEVISN